MSLVDKFFKARNEMLESANCNGVEYKLEDYRECYWYSNGSDIVYHEEKEVLLDEDKGEYFADEIIRGGIYKGKKITIAECDTGCGYRHTLILDNSKMVEVEY